MTTAYGQVTNTFYRKMNDLDARKRFPYSQIIDHAASQHAIEAWKVMNQVQRLALCLDLFTLGREN